LGHENAGVFSNNDELCEKFLKSAEMEGEGAWRLPLSKSYEKLLKSRIADVANIGGRTAGAITAAKFLERFITNNTPWIHIDIAGVAFLKSSTTLGPRGATGWGVASLNNFISKYYEEKN
jgi:leucyl aminopeptidase